MKKLEDIHLLNNWLDDNKKYSEEFRALCLKLIDEYDGNIPPKSPKCVVDTKKALTIVACLFRKSFISHLSLDNRKSFGCHSCCIGLQLIYTSSGMSFSILS
ncbi:hypothetical protein PEPS_38330 (plasmid) [Persicobacter psychrovividus]|uniref:Uncharacterized protein n=1 Tax=Persicobacter psychrovividus TaxID=387638 RepID=A0ABM7VKM0_9BACT|nr:hypothetical protein PEPS_38330 [Persicobacter psychrovividus]